MTLTLNSPAKINLFLDIVGKRENGYHELKTVFQKLELSDKVTIETLDSGIEIECDNPEVPLDESNTCYKVMKVLKEKYGIDKGLRISIEKKIPVSSGLGGGSSNGGAVLKGMNELFELNLTRGEMIAIGKSIGADIPLFLYQEPCLYAEGIGEDLKPLNNLLKEELYLIYPNIDFPENFHKTKWAFEKSDKRNWRHPDPKEITDAIETGNKEKIYKNLYNAFEPILMEKFPIIEEIKYELKKEEIPSLMSGAGPTITAFSEAMPQRIKNYGEVIKTRTSD